MIKLVVFDFDGVFTNGKILINQERVLKYYNVKDGTGIIKLQNNNIKTGIISAYKHNNTNVNEIVKHLNIDYYSYGENNKYNVLQKWINELNININNVAYIGDDESDLEILQKVQFSSCPNDAIEQVKNIVNYICEHKGGEGCVREFIEYILNNKIKLNTIDQIKKESLYQLNNFPDITFIVNKIQNCYGNIYFTGIGKSENIAIHCCNLLKSIGYKSFYINLLNTSHGNIGTINNNDIIFFFSKSGNTNEIINIINYFKCYKIGICCNNNNYFSKYCNYTLVIPMNNELYNTKNINYIPTNSYMAQTFFCNILINTLINEINITIDDYKKFHPGGNIGQKLLKVKDVLITNFPKIILNNNVTLNSVLLEMTKYNIGCCFFVNNNGDLLGLLTDGDIRRLLIKNTIKNIILQNINTNYKYIDNNMFIKDIKDNNSKFLPVIINKFIGIIDCRA